MTDGGGGLSQASSCLTPRCSFKLPVILSLKYASKVSEERLYLRPVVLALLKPFGLLLHTHRHPPPHH